MLRIFTDFDGPIMDVSERYYQVYQYCLEKLKDPSQPIKLLSKQNFWQLKRAQIPERQIGTISGLYDDQARQFARLRRETVHSLAYLKYDCLIPHTVDTLEKVQAMDSHLVVVTMRRTRALNLALATYQLERFFPPEVRYCLPDEYVKTYDEVEKTRLLAQALEELPNAHTTWMIGDTEADITAAQAHQVPVVAVLSGIRDRDRLTACKPDFIVNNLQAAIATIAAQMSSSSNHG